MKYDQNLVACKGVVKINHVYIHSFRSIIEATQKLTSNLVIFPGVEAFEQLFGPVRGGFEQKFSKNSNARGVCWSFNLTGTDYETADGELTNTNVLKT